MRGFVGSALVGDCALRGVDKGNYPDIPVTGDAKRQ